MAREVPSVCVEFIKWYEKYHKALPDGGCRSYLDQRGTWTIGFGSTGPDVGPRTVWTRAYAEKRLSEDIGRAARAAERVTSAPLTDNQFSALVSLLYNAGVNCLNDTITGRLFREGRVDEAFLRFPLWNKVRINGTLVASAGLTSRRKAELALSRGNWKPGGGHND